MVWERVWGAGLKAAVSPKKADVTRGVVCRVIAVKKSYSNSIALNDNSASVTSPQLYSRR